MAPTDDFDDDDDWEDRPPPVTAVAIRVEEAVVEAIRTMAEPRGMTPGELMRRWVLERLDAERNPSPAPAKKAAPKKKVAAPRKKAATTKAPAKKRA